MSQGPWNAFIRPSYHSGANVDAPYGGDRPGARGQRNRRTGRKQEDRVHGSDTGFSETTPDQQPQTERTVVDEHP